MAEALARTQQHLQDHLIFHGHPDVWKALAPYLRSKLLGKDASIFHHGEPAHSLCIVLKGWVKLTRQTPDGKETIAGLCTDGDLFGEAALFPNADYPCNAEAITPDTELAFLPSEHIRALIAKNAALSRIIMSMLNDRISQTQLKLEHMSTMSTAQRLGCFLLQLCNRVAEGAHSLHIPIEKCLLASYLGMKPETLSRSQAQLKTAGVTIQGSDVTISSIPKLRHFVCNSCSESGTCESDNLD